MLPSKEEVLDFLGVSLEEHYSATWPDGQEFQGLSPPHQPRLAITGHHPSCLDPLVTGMQYSNFLPDRSLNAKCWN